MDGAPALALAQEPCVAPVTAILLRHSCDAATLDDDAPRIFEQSARFSNG